MAEKGTNAGAVSLELVVENTLGEQFKNMESAARSSAERTGETLKNAVSSPLESLGSELRARTESAMQDIQKVLESSELTADPTEKLVWKLINTKEKIQELGDKWKELESSLMNENISVSQIEEIDSQMTKLEQEMLKLSDTADNLKNRIEKNVSEISDGSLKNVPESIEESVNTSPIKSYIERVRAEFSELGTAITSPIKNIETLDTATSSTAEKAKKAGEAVGNVFKHLGKTAGAVTSPLRTIGTAAYKSFETVKEAGKRSFTVLKTAAEMTFSAVKTTAKTAFSALKSTGKSAVSSLKNAFKSLKTIGGKALDSLKSKFGFLNKSAGTLAKPVEKLGRILKNTFRRVFVMATIYAAARAMKKALGEILNANEEFSKSLNEVKANLSIAFTPIIQAAMPAINTLMSGLSAVTKQIAAFISGLFGMTYKQAAEATQKLKNTAKTAQDTAKKVKLSTAGIDEMNILSDGSESSSDSSSDDDSGIDYSKLDMSEPELPDWVEHLKNAIKSGDWNGVGAAFAEKINSIFEGIDWEKFEKKVSSAVGKICELLNGLLDNVNWKALGTAFSGGINAITAAINTFAEKIHWENLGINIASGLNTAIQKIKWTQLGKALAAKIRILTNILHGFVVGFDWKGLGKGIGEAVNGWFDGIDFGKLGATISEGIKGILDTALSFIYTVKWQDIGEKLRRFVSNIDWSGIADRIFELFGAALGAASSMFWGFVKDIVKKGREFFSKEFEKFDTGNIGLNIILGILDGILQGLIGIGNWIIKHVFNPISDGFRKAFDIHSPSRKMAEIGGYIVDGLLNAIADGIEKIKRICEKMLQKIKDVFAKIDNWFGEKFSSAWDKIKTAWNGVKKWFSDLWNGIKKIFSSVGDWFGKKFTSAWKNIKTSFSSAGEFFGRIWRKISDCFANAGDWFRDKFQAAYNGITGIFSGIGDFFKGVWNDVSNTARDGINRLIGHVESGINKIIDGLNMFGFDLPEVMGGGHVGFDIAPVNLPRLAKGGLAAAPTLALVGDNPNARTDPEVISPLSKLKEMGIGDNSEIIGLMNIVVELLRDGISAEINGDFKRAVLRAVSDDRVRRGG